MKWENDWSHGLNKIYKYHSKDTHFRWKIKWWLELLGELRIMGEMSSLELPITWNQCNFYLHKFAVVRWAGLKENGDRCCCNFTVDFFGFEGWNGCWQKNNNNNKQTLTYMFRAALSNFVILWGARFLCLCEVHVLHTHTKSLYVGRTD